jgi:hypothetical protein
MQSTVATKGLVVRTPDVGSGERCVRVVCVSDTHDRHWELIARIPHGDVLIHAGDFFTRLKGERAEIEARTRDLNDFFAALPHKHKVRAYVCVLALAALKKACTLVLEDHHRGKP